MSQPCYARLAPPVSLVGTRRKSSRLEIGVQARNLNAYPLNVSREPGRRAQAANWTWHRAAERSQ